MAIQIDRANVLAEMKSAGVAVAIVHESVSSFPFAVYERLGRARNWQRVDAFPEAGNALRFAGERFAFQAQMAVNARAPV